MVARAYLLLFVTVFFLFGSNTKINAQSNPGNWTEVSSNENFFIQTGFSFGYNEPQFIRSNQLLYIHFLMSPVYNLKARFDGGNWVTINSGTCSQFEALNHPWTSPNDLGEHELEIKYANGAGTVVTRKWTIFVMPPAQKVFQDDYGNSLVMWDNNNIVDKPMVVVEGFDPQNENNAALYYAGGINFFQPAINDGYDVLIMQFANGGQDLTVNSQYVENAIKFLNSFQSNNYGVVLAGVSMGGVIARHTLAKAEHENDYLNVPLFISMDAPQQGAVIDSEFLDYIESNQPNNPSLGSKAAYQLLKYSPFIVPNTLSHNGFYNQLNNYNGDGYPKKTLNVGVAFSNRNHIQDIGRWLSVDLNPSIDFFDWFTFILNQTLLGYLNPDAHFYVSNNDDIMESGSYLPLSSTRLWGIELGLVEWAAIRYQDNTNPSFIQTSSALDLNQSGESKFDIVIEADKNYFHDEVPGSVIPGLLSVLSTHNQTLSGNISISSGSTYLYSGTTNIQAGTNITLGTGSELVFTGPVTISNAANFIIGKDSKITFKDDVSAIGTQSNPITFKSTNPSDVNVRYDRVEFDDGPSSAASVDLQWCIFEGGFINASFTEISASIKNSTFRKGAFGIRALNSGVFPDKVHIHDNSSTGILALASELYVKNSRIEDNGSHGIDAHGINYLVNIYKSVIENNYNYGVRGQTDLGSIHIDRSRIKNNQKHEIWVSNSATLSLGYSSGDKGYNNVSDNVQGYGSGKRYIYRSSLTSMGENQIGSPTYAYRNYWGYYYPVSNMFYGTVYTNNHLSTDPTTGLNPLNYPAKIRANKGVKNVTTNAINENLQNANSSNDSEIIHLKEKLLNIRNDIAIEADLIKKISFLRDMRNSLLLDKENLTQEKLEYDRIRLELKDLLSDPDFLTALEVQKTKRSAKIELELASQYLDLIDMEERFINNEFQEIISESDELLTYANNQDLRKSILSLKMYSQEKKGDFLEALETLNSIEGIKPDKEIAEGTYQPTDFSSVRFYLEEMAGLKPDRTLYNTYPALDYSPGRNIEGGNESKPTNYRLIKAYPNPFNPSTNISFDLPERSLVNVAVFDINGRLISLLANGQMNAGTHTLRFDANGAASGVYIIRAQLGNTQFFDKVTLIK